MGKGVARMKLFTVKPEDSELVDIALASFALEVLA